jgi:2-C-methyl-D-erythritol 4-phosphate cytidylyltransferase
LDRLRRALEGCLESGNVPTDESAAMERAGARPLLVMGSSQNVKITYPGDIEIVENWFRCGDGKLDHGD